MKGIGKKEQSKSLEVILLNPRMEKVLIIQNWKEIYQTAQKFLFCILIVTENGLQMMQQSPYNFEYNTYILEEILDECISSNENIYFSWFKELEKSK